MSNPAPLPSEVLQPYRQQLRCNFPQLDQVFPDLMAEAQTLLSATGVADYLDGASLICRIGRGFEPVLVYLEEMPHVASGLGEETLGLVSQSVWKMSRSPNGRAILPFLQTIAEAGRRLGSGDLLRQYCELILGFMERTSGSIHGQQTTIPSPSLPDLLERIPFLLGQLTLAGLSQWMDYGVRHYADHPDRQRDYFSLNSADSRAVLQRERHGTLFADNERRLDLYLRALWRERRPFVPYSEAFDELRKPVPYVDALGVRIPDCYDDRAGVAGIDRYRALLAHVAAHLRWSGSLVADNLSPFQRVAVETFEDCRVDCLAMREYPGLRPLLLALHPRPEEGACDPEGHSCVRHRLALFSRACLDPDHGYRDPDLLDFVARFHARLAEGPASTQDMADLAVSYMARTRRQQDLSPRVWFTDTVVDYRDDNRHLWRYIEQGDEEDAFDQPERRQVEDLDALPPRHYPEWDYKTRTYRPDWVSLYEALHPSADPARIDALLAKHRGLAKRLKQILDLLKPQQYVRLRYQEEGTDLDLDVAIRSLIDFRAGITPDPRINMNHRTDGRDIAVMLLLDLSQSLDQVPEGCTQSILELSQEAVALLGWAIEHLGDEFAIAGFSSNTRHEVRYQHIKGYSERWGDPVKARLAAMEAGYSTRMGAALRHAAHYLSARQAEKRLMLILTDGQPHDIDVEDERLLIEDTHKAVQELDQQGIFTYCINLDRQADAYVRDCFGQRFTVIDRVERLPEQLPRLFMALTR